jgi:hypothetical protein
MRAARVLLLVALAVALLVGVCVQASEAPAMSDDALELAMQDWMAEAGGDSALLESDSDVDAELEAESEKFNKLLAIARGKPAPQNQQKPGSKKSVLSVLGKAASSITKSVQKSAKKVHAAIGRKLQQEKTAIKASLKAGLQKAKSVAEKAALFLTARRTSTFTTLASHPHPDSPSSSSFSTPRSHSSILPTVRELFSAAFA